MCDLVHSSDYNSGKTGVNILQDAQRDVLQPASSQEPQQLPVSGPNQRPEAFVLRFHTL